MADEAIAVVVAGAGPTSEKEVADLLEDYLEKWGDNVDLIVPVNKTMFTDSVQNAVAWFNDPDYIIPVRVDDGPLARASSSLGKSMDTQKVAEFADLFKDDFEGYDEVLFAVALPNQDDAQDDYDEAVSWIEAAAESKANVTIKDLCAGLDDVVITDEPTPEPDPEPEPAPRRRGRSRASEPEPQPVKDENPPRRSRARRSEEPKDVHDEVAAAVAEKEAGPKEEHVKEAMNAFADGVLFIWHWEEASKIVSGKDDGGFALRKRLEDAHKVLLAALGLQNQSPSVTQPGDAAEPVEAAPTRGRGRPRKNFEEKQILDEETNEWGKPGRGRLAKGTKWRVVDTRNDEVLDEGTV